MALESAANAIIITDREGHISWVNLAFVRMTGYSAEEAIGQKPSLLKSGEQDIDFYTNLWQTITAGQVWHGELINRRKDGSFYHEEQTITPVRDPQGTITHFIAIKQDVTERKRLEAHLSELANHDLLTGLLNRRRFEEELTLHLAPRKRDGTRGAILCADMDRLKEVNDSFGHTVGDIVLCEVADLVRQAVQESDLLARLGGDEFVILLHRSNANEAQEIAARILASVREHTVAVNGRPLRVTMSIGIALFPDHGLTVEDLFARADEALYRAKEEGRNRFALFSAQDVRQHHRSAAMGWAERIRAALAGDGFLVHTQPIIDLQNGQTLCYELLLRLQDDQGTLIHPGAFLDTADRFGLMAQIDQWVVVKAIEILREQSTTNTRLRLSVNLSARAIRNRDLLALIDHAVKHQRVAPESLLFEITETAAVSDFQEARSLISTLAKYGCQFALDDFGVGFSSFSHLQHLPVHYLKLDGSFIHNLPNNRMDQHLVRAMVQVAQGLGKQTIAECVENEETARLLRQYGVNFGLGVEQGRKAVK